MSLEATPGPRAAHSSDGSRRGLPRGAHRHADPLGSAAIRPKIQWTLDGRRRAAAGWASASHCANASRHRCARWPICSKPCAKAITPSARAASKTDDAMSEVMPAGQRHELHAARAAVGGARSHHAAAKSDGGDRRRRLRVRRRPPPAAGQSRRRADAERTG